MYFKKNISLKPYTSYRVGGQANFFIEVNKEEELKEILLKWKKEQNGPIFVLGGGTNILVSDKGFKGLVVKIAIDFIKQDEDVLEVGAGTLMADLVNFCGFNSLSGFEWAGGLPGTVGGAVRGNAGAFGGETKDNVLEVKSLNIDSMELIKRLKDDCQFGYRQSFFKKDGAKEIITSVKFTVAPGDGQEIQKQVEEKIKFRRERHPLEYPNAGSTFKNVSFDSIPKSLKEEFKVNIKTDPFPVVAAARLLNLCQLKGKKVGEAQFSEKHPNYIVNLGEATAEDVRSLVEIAKETVQEKFGVKLEEEITYLG